MSRARDQRFEHWLRLVREAGWQVCAEGNARVKLLAMTEIELTTTQTAGDPIENEPSDASHANASDESYSNDPNA
ncbi:MAG TPA: hypothetical protein VOA41_08375 [Candidatus Dormibacteraeota bacterium]|nr:hypothetical protein [Candidatus Dormibacteraeota bacterium]